MKVQAVGDVLFAPVGDVDRAVRADFDVDGAEGGVFAFQGVNFVFGAEGGAVREAFGQDDVAVERVAAEHFAVVAFGECSGFVDGEGVGETGDIGVPHVREFAEGVGVGGRAVFAGVAFVVVPAFPVMVATGVAAVGACEDAALGVELDEEGVAAAGGEDLEFSGQGVVAPDGGAFDVDGFF